jgi:hypothetical protein
VRPVTYPNTLIFVDLPSPDPQDPPAAPGQLQGPAPRVWNLVSDDDPKIPDPFTTA